MPGRSNSKFLLHSTEISEHMVLEGELETEASLLVKGGFSGSIRSKSRLTIDKTGNVASSDLEAVTIVVFGRAGGDLCASESISVEDRAIVNGKLRSPQVRISEMAKFEGRISTTASGD